MNDIDWQTAAQVGATAVTALVAIAGFLTGPGALRSRLKADIELLDKLPDDSAAHARLLGHIDHQIATVESLDKDASRDLSGAVIGFTTTIGLAWLTVILFDTDNRPWGWEIWSWIFPLLGVAIGVVALAGLVYLFEALQRVPRDAKGNRIRS